MSREPQPWADLSLKMGIILTMLDQMTPVIESSVVMAQVLAAAVPCLFQPRRNAWLMVRHCLKTRFIRDRNRFCSGPRGDLLPADQAGSLDWCLFHRARCVGLPLGRIVGTKPELRGC